jgi:transcriptional regulator with XRE-family HTH domain
MWNMEQLDWTRLGAAIVSAYESLGLSHTEFAELAGVSRSTLHRLERGLGGTPSDSTLAKVERAVGWEHGAARAVAAGGAAPSATGPRVVAFSKPEALSEPSVLDQLPVQVREELRQSGTLLGADVVDLGPDGSGARMIIVATRDASGAELDPEVLRATLVEWQRKRRELWRQGDAPPV